jgi:hypothetical protein
VTANEHGLGAGTAAVLARLRRGDGGGQARRGFTVARNEALLRLREVPRAPWAWTLELLRAARLLDVGGRAAVLEAQEGDERVVTLRFEVAGCDLAGAELRGLLHAAVAGDEDMSQETGWLGERGRRWRARVGAALNAGLAAGPRSLELRTSADARAYVRRDTHAAGHDPYAEQPAPGRCAAQTFEVVLREARPGIGRRLAAWLARQASATAQVEARWREGLLISGDGPGPFDLARPLPGARVELGAHATWGAAPELGGPWLVREGVRALSLARALARAEVPTEGLGGWIDCPTLRLTADEAEVSQDAAFDLLVAWLHDLRAHTVAAAGEGPQWRAPDGATVTVAWPAQVERVTAASGRAVEVATVAQRVDAGRDLLYTWAHLRGAVPPAMQARTYALWPSQLAALQRQVPGLRPVPLRALGDAPQVERADLSRLAEGSLAAVDLAALPPVSGVTPRARAYVHRYPNATEGAVVLLAYGRRVGHVREASRVVAGVTLVCELEGADIAALQGDAALLREISARCRAAAAAAMPTLLAQGMAHATPWEVPVVRAQATALTGATLGVRLRGDRDGRVALAWEESPLLGLPVGRDETQSRAVTLLRVLGRVRDAGGVVVESPGQPWPGWASQRPAHAPWSLTPEGRALCERVVGKDVLWDMPTLPEMHLLPEPAEAQPGLLLAPDELARLREKLAEERPRAALAAHLLAARATGRDPAGLHELPLFKRFDPRALQPLRRVSLAQALAESPGLALAGAATRALAGPALLVTPGEALRLVAEGLRPAAVAAPAAAAGPALARPQRRAEGAAGWLVVPVASEVAVGALRLTDAPTKVALWGGGLHVDDLELPGPLACVGGRLVLTKQGARAGGDRLAGEIRGMCRAVVARALEQRRLHPPGSPPHAAIGAFLERCREAAARGEAPLVADLLSQEPDAEARPGAKLAASLQRTPLHRLPAPGPRRFESALRQALARPLAVGAAILSWQAARLVRPADAGLGWEIELGRRNAAVQRATAADAGPEDAFVAAALAIAGAFAGARAAGAPASELEDEWIADYRLLALVYAHAP